MLTIVIPALNEIDHIASTVASARHEACEVIVVDGGSSDGTPQAARQAGARVIVTAPGRGRQMNVGAQAAQIADLRRQLAYLRTEAMAHG